MTDFRQWCQGVLTQCPIGKIFVSNSTGLMASSVWLNILVIPSHGIAVVFNIFTPNIYIAHVKHLVGQQAIVPKSDGDASGAPNMGTILSARSLAA